MTELAAIYTTREIQTSGQSLGDVANTIAASGVFTVHQILKSDNTNRSARTDLDTFAEYLRIAGMGSANGFALYTDPHSWAGITWGLVDMFVKWQLSNGYAISTVNRRLSTIKVYARLAVTGEGLDMATYQLIAIMKPYSGREATNLNKARTVTRIKGSKKADSQVLSPNQATSLMSNPDTAQGARDNLLMCILLEHGLRASEAELLTAGSINTDTYVLTFYRPKTDTTGTHKLTANTLKALLAYMPYMPTGSDMPLLRGSRKGGALNTTTKHTRVKIDSKGNAILDDNEEPVIEVFYKGSMSTRAITKRARMLGQSLGLSSLSAHDCRHYAATDMAAKGYAINELMDWFGWTSPATAMRYIDSAKVSERNKG